MAEEHRNYFQINLQWGCLFSVCLSICFSLQIVQAVTERQIFVCGYHLYHPYTRYDCELVTQQMTKPHRHHSAFSHERGKTNDNVEGVFISKFTTFRTESKIGQTFRNLKKLHISDESDTTLKHNIFSTTFENMENLIDLDIQLCGKESVDVGFLASLPNLEKIEIEVLPKDLDENFHGNSTVNVSQSTFQANSKLKDVSLMIVGSVPWNLFRNNLLLEIVSLLTKTTELDVRTFETNVKLTEIKLVSTSLESIPWNLFKNNVKLARVQLGFRMTQIDGRTFETNKELKVVTMSSNQLEFLPRDLFKDNLLLERIDFRRNKLQIIEIDFSALANVRYIDLSENSCINSTFGSYWDSKNVTEFQREIGSACISNSSPNRI